MAASLPPRDKLAQLLMVGVTGADDARAVVANHHVGGIFIGSWADLTMLNDGSLRTIAASTGPLPLAVSVDEEGGRVERLSSVIGSQPSPRVLAQSMSVGEVHYVALRRGLKMKALGITIDFAPVVDVTNAPDDTVIGDRSFGADPDTVDKYVGAYAQGPARRRAIAGAQTLPRSRPCIRRPAPGWGDDAAAARSAVRRFDPLPHTDHGEPGRRDGRSHAGARPYRH